jgi:hypothetical protein
MSKLMETNELMLAIEQMLIKNLNASIIGHGQCTTDTMAADFIEKYMKKDASLRVVQLVQPRDATVDLKRKALDTITSKATMALTFAETLELLTKNHGTAHTENALRYVMNLLVQEGKLEQTNVDGRVLYARKDK